MSDSSTSDDDSFPDIVTEIWDNWRAVDGRGPCANCPSHWSRRPDIPDTAKEHQHSYGMDPWYGDGSFDADVVVVGQEPGKKCHDKSSNKVNQEYQQSNEDIREVPIESESITVLDEFFTCFYNNNVPVYWTELMKCNEIYDEEELSEVGRRVCSGIDSERSYLKEEIVATDTNYIVTMKEDVTRNVLRLYNHGADWDNFTSFATSGENKAGLREIEIHGEVEDLIVVPMIHPVGYPHLDEKYRNLSGNSGPMRNYFRHFAEELASRI